MDELMKRVKLSRDWVVAWGLLDDETYAETDWCSHTITLDVRLTRYEARSALAVELERRERGPCCPDVVAEQAAARKLIPLEDLATVVGFTAVPWEMAATLGVDEDLLRARLEGLSVDERVSLLARVTSCDCCEDDCWVVLVPEP